MPASTSSLRVLALGLPLNQPAGALPVIFLMPSMARRTCSRSSYSAHIVIIDPAIAVANDLMPIREKGLNSLGAFLKRAYDAENADADIELFENSKQTPDADARTIFEALVSTIGLRTP